MLVQAFISKFTIKAFHEGFLSRFSWLDKTQPNTAVVLPEEHRFARKLGTIPNIEEKLTYLGKILERLEKRNLIIHA